MLKALARYLNVSYVFKPVTSGADCKARYEELKLEFPNIPCVKDGDLTISQSGAVAAYIIMKGGDMSLAGKTPDDMVTAKMVLGH